MPEPRLQSRRCSPHAACASRATKQPVFGPLDFAVDAGEALLVQGDNGAGKTTLLRVLAGLLRADAGEIDIDGRRATTVAARARDRLPRPPRRH